MKALVLYDSAYGNTEKIARAIGAVLGKPAEVKVLKPAEATAADLKGVEIVVVGTPVQGGRATKALLEWIGALPEGTLKGVKVAVFDTRMKHFVAKVLGYAADRLARTLKDKGGVIVGEPQGYWVKGKEGPLADGETDRAATWARGLLK
jgi:flavodoxin